LDNSDKNLDDRPNINVRGDYIGRSKAGGDYVEQGTINKNVYNLQGDGIILGNNNEVTKSIQNIDPQFKESIIGLENLLKDKLKDIQITDEQKKELQKDVKKLTEEVKGVNPNEVLQDEDKIDEIKATQMSLAEKIVNFVPQAAESIAAATPLALFSKPIGKGAGFFAEWIIKKLNRNKK
jgi:hypothetical protein